MELHFTCPEKQSVFRSSDYYLHDGYEIVLSDTGEKKLVGRVSLQSECPLCGQYHTYRADEVICTYG